MQSWNMGYDTDTNYNFGYFSQLNPLILKFVFLTQRLAFPKLGPDTTACELGFGNGISVIMHGAATDVKWYGTDFNPSQVNFAQQLARTGHVPVDLRDDAFGDFAKREDVPMFDYICLHGIWSWINKDNQNIIVDFVRNKLKVGGVLYVSYNTSPGFNYIEPIRKILDNYANLIADPALNHVQKVAPGIDFIKKLIELKPGYVTAAPWVEKHFEQKMVSQDHNYVAHEYLNGNWFVEHFDDVAAKFETAKLTYICQARLSDNVDDMNLKKEEQEILAPLKGTPVYQASYDYVTGQQFRSDLYVKGALQLSEKQFQEQLDATHMVLMVNFKDDDFTIRTRLGTDKVDMSRVRKIIHFLSDYKVHSFAELRAELAFDPDAPAPQGDTTGRIPQEELLDNLVYAICSGLVALAVDPATITNEVKERCLTLNANILQGYQKNSIAFLSSPVLAGGHYVDDITKIMINLVQRIKGVTEEEITRAILSIAGDDVPMKLKDREITDPKEKHEVVRKQVHRFMTFDLPSLKRLMVI